ncbi:MAG: decarboxylating 6-phosphogluconate dehydrogenase [Thermoanaerobaculia bacterium]
MQIGFVGLGKMGGNMVKRLLGDGHAVVVSDRSPDAIAASAKEGAAGASSLADLVRKLKAPRAVWVMVPSGAPTQGVIDELAGLLAPGDLVVDGGNSNFHDSRRRAEQLKAKGLLFVDAGTSGGIWGLTVGYCLMCGGEPDAISRLAPALTTLAPKDGWLHTGPPGSGHYVKMVHNGIEYAIMQAYAEGFELFNASGLGLDNAKIAALWMQGSVVRSWLLELAADALKKNPSFDGIAPWVEDSGEGRWTVVESIDRAVPTPVITASLQARFRSRQENAYGPRFLNALRNEFGGHTVVKKP